MFQGCRYCRRAIAFTELLAGNVRMSHIVVRACRVWIQGNHTVRTISVEIVQPAQVQLDLERSERYVLQRNWIRDNADRVFTLIEIYVPELILQLVQFFHDLR